MENLLDMQIVHAKKGEGVTEDEIKEYTSQVPGWCIVERDGMKKLERTFKFKNFAQALEFTNMVGELAEREDHHPAILTEWGKVTVTLWTHSAGGLHRNDFILAAKIEQVLL